ncbi:conserved hypothetical protein [Trichormus variabilis ATCC 29413]|uniref:Uncharacterized protein n=2 Tax=Anabaena variabilis TaxID=264691 RepID=Q3M6N1_TRIV2|nr:MULTISPECIES: hypothetical protein [Nostocaceae]ABA23355.1 conserved hypothetical protein [Trichormus variabilis ATCC 29413]MBC1214299.1 hypothetical protein [Trichormus variabilis ARAD]MBC1269468.1 hypothetical protein [Trichormus variabilis FSR]MBC1305091.1 hypothetical protein [Trichormus variabilis N2B]MBC1310988.1 hypothetical protein [Trichormus variabilis PNB]
MKQIEPSYKTTISLPLMLPQVTVNKAIVPLQPQSESLSSGWERLITVVQHINQMAIELEAKILELKTIASTINSQINYLTENSDRPYISICQYSSVSVPVVKQQPDQSFILTTRKVDLFRAEREAAQLAQQLRQHTQKKKSAPMRN